jgi:hypothetical protein
MSATPIGTPTISEINTIGATAAGIASVVPGGQPTALGIGAATAIADLVVHLSSLYSQKVITASQLTTMVNISVSGFDSAVAGWDAAAPTSNTTTATPVA